MKKLIFFTSLIAIMIAINPMHANAQKRAHDINLDANQSKATLHVLASDTINQKYHYGKGTFISLDSLLSLSTKIKTNSRTDTIVVFTSAQYGKTLFWSPNPTIGAIATLPANGAPAGSWFDVILLTNKTVTISSATADTLITDGDTAADSVAYSTSSHKIGSHVRFISNGSYWIAVNIGGTTMTVAS